MKPITILRKKAKLGDQGFPRATLAFYGPDDKKATKAALGIFLREGDEPTIHLYAEGETPAQSEELETELRTLVTDLIEREEIGVAR